MEAYKVKEILKRPLEEPKNHRALLRYYYKELQNLVRNKADCSEVNQLKSELNTTQQMINTIIEELNQKNKILSELHIRQENLINEVMKLFLAVLEIKHKNRPTNSQIDEMLQKNLTASELSADITSIFEGLGIGVNVVSVSTKEDEILKKLKKNLKPVKRR
jgi:hypothetical protein